MDIFEVKKVGLPAMSGDCTFDGEEFKPDNVNLNGWVLKDMTLHEAILAASNGVAVSHVEMACGDHMFFSGGALRCQDTRLETWLKIEPSNRCWTIQTEDDVPF